MKKLIITILVITVAFLLLLPMLGKFGEKTKKPPNMHKIETLIIALNTYEDTYRHYPSGANKEIIHSLDGNNSRNIKFIGIESKLNKIGEYIDPWGTPYIIGIDDKIKVRSAGPDKLFYNKDDILEVSNKMYHNTLDNREKITICEVHNVTLVDDTVEYKNMTIEFEPKYEKEMRSRFPHLGFGFGIEDPKIKYVLINYCPKCVEENKKYMENEDKKYRDKNP